MNNMSKTELETFYKDLSPRVFRYAMLKTSSHETAEDVTSETFLRLIAAEDREEVQNMSAWSFGIARNVIYETYRDRDKKSDINETEMEFFDLPTKTELEDQVIEDELYELLKTEIQSLDEITREIIGLRVWEELSFAEIAEIVEMKESATKLRFYRGLEQLKQSCKSGTKARSIAWPILLAGFLKLAGDATYAPDPKYLSNLLGILHTQMSDIPKPDPITPTQGSVGQAVPANTKTGVAEATPPAPSLEPAANAAAQSADFQTMLRVGWARVQTRDFLLKLFAYSAAAMVVVGGISLASIQMANTQIVPRNPITVRDNGDSTPIEPDGGIGNVPLTGICDNDGLGVRISYPNGWKCVSETKGEDLTLSSLFMTKDNFSLIISDAGRGPYCQEEGSETCQIEEYLASETFELENYYHGDYLKEIFGMVTGQLSESAGQVHISFIDTSVSDPELEEQLELNPAIEAELQAILDSMELWDVEQKPAPLTQDKLNLDPNLLLRLGGAYPMEITSLYDDQLVSLNNCQFQYENPSDVITDQYILDLLNSLENFELILDTPSDIDVTTTDTSRENLIQKVSYCETEAEGEYAVILAYPRTEYSSMVENYTVVGILDQDQFDYTITGEGGFYSTCNEIFALTVEGIMYYECGGGDGTASFIRINKLDTRSKNNQEILNCVGSDTSSNGLTADEISCE